VLKEIGADGGVAMKVLREAKTFNARGLNFVWIPLIFSFIYCLFLGNWRLKLDVQATLVDAQWWQINRLLQGHADLGIHGLGGDSITNHNGDTVAYWLPFPGLVRLLVSILFRGIDALPGIKLLSGQNYYSIPSMTLSYFVALISICLLVRKLIYIKFASLNSEIKISSAIYLIACLLVPYWYFFPTGSVYLESISWAVSLSFLLTYLFISYVYDDSWKNLAFYSVTLICIFFTRIPEIIFASLLTIILILYTCRKSFQKSLVISLSFSLGALLLLLLNKARWNSYFILAPMQNHIAIVNSDSRSSTYEKFGNFELSRFLTNLDYYFFLSSKSFDSKYPFLSEGTLFFEKSLKTMDYVESKVTIWLVFPGFTIVSLIGAASIFYLKQTLDKSQFRKVTLMWFFGSSIGLTSLLFAPALAIRYLADWLVFFVLTFAVGITTMVRQYKENAVKFAKRTLYLLIALICLQSMANVLLYIGVVYPK
jgi:hypothetical protein